MRVSDVQARAVRRACRPTNFRPGLGRASVKANSEDWGTGFFAVVTYQKKVEFLPGLSREDCLARAVKFCREVLLLPSEHIAVDGMFLQS